MTTTRTRYNKSKIMRNAWYLKRANASMTFSACLRKAWRNEKPGGHDGDNREPPDGGIEGCGMASAGKCSGRLLRQQQNVLRRLTITGGVPPLNTYYGN